MNTAAAHHITDTGRHCDDPDPGELDTAILAELTACGGGPVEWAAVRANLPRSRYWRPVEALCRLHAAGRVTAAKHGGRTYLAEPTRDAGAA